LSTTLYSVKIATILSHINQSPDAEQPPAGARYPVHYAPFLPRDREDPDELDLTGYEKFCSSPEDTSILSGK
jgi:hypothetical protein